MPVFFMGEWKRKVWLDKDTGADTNSMWTLTAMEDTTVPPTLLG